MPSYKYEFDRLTQFDNYSSKTHYILSYDQAYQRIGPETKVPIVDGMFGDRRVFNSSNLLNNATELSFAIPQPYSTTGYKPSYFPEVQFRKSSDLDNVYRVTDVHAGFDNSTIYQNVLPSITGGSDSHKLWPKTGFHANMNAYIFHTVNPTPALIHNDRKFSLSNWTDLNIRSSKFKKLTITYNNDYHPLRMIYDDNLKSSRFMNSSDDQEDFLLNVNLRNSLSSKHENAYFLQNFKIIKFLNPCLPRGTAKNYAKNFLIKTQDGFIIETRTGQNLAKAKLKIYSPYKGNNSLIDYYQNNYFIDFYVRTIFNYDYSQFVAPILPFYYNTW